MHLRLTPFILASMTAACGNAARPPVTAAPPTAAAPTEAAPAADVSPPTALGAEAGPVLDGALLAAEEGKLAGCPGETTVTYAGNPNAPRFGAVKKAAAQVRGPGQISVRMANAPDAELSGDEVVKGTLRLDLDLVAGPGREVVSGRYARRADLAPALASAVMHGAPPPGDGAAGAEDCASWVECTPATSWSGADSAVEVIARTRTRICGRFHLKDGAHEASGVFDVPLSIE